ncbi:MAG: nuclear transport factor 2 family protein [Terriglobia bacterium]
MKRRIVWGMAAASLILLGSIPLAAAAPKVPKTEKIIQDLEARRFKAIVDVDLTALDALLAPDMSYSHSSGLTQTKTEFIDALRRGEMKYLEIKPEGLKVRTYGNTAVVTGRGEFKTRTKGQESAVELRFLDVYVKRQGRWQMVAWQSCRLAQ